jgi:hypothetical protein
VLNCGWFITALSPSLACLLSLVADGSGGWIFFAAAACGSFAPRLLLWNSNNLLTMMMMMMIMIVCNYFLAFSAANQLDQQQHRRLLMSIKFAAMVYYGNDLLVADECQSYHIHNSLWHFWRLES